MHPYSQQPYPGTLGGSRELTLVNSYMRRVYNWMAGVLALSALVAWLLTTSPALLGVFVK